MSILNFLKKIKLPSFDDEFIVDPVDQVTPEHGRRMQALAAMHREKVFADKPFQARQLELEEYLDEEYERADPLNPGATSYYDPWTHMNEL